MLNNYNLFRSSLNEIIQPKALISTINAHSYNILHKDRDFQNALLCSDILLPDGISVVWAMRWLKGEKIEKIAGADLFFFEMKRMNAINGKCFFLGSSEETLTKIKKRAEEEYPNVKIYTNSPPYESEFNDDENKLMIDSVNAVQPDVLFIGMTAPKQEKWAHQHFSELKTGHVCCIGAVFDFYARTIDRAPQWMIKIGLEWFFRLIKEPRRLWRRYLIGNVKFVSSVVLEKIQLILNIDDQNYFPNEQSKISHLHTAIKH